MIDISDLNFSIEKLNNLMLSDDRYKRYNTLRDLKKEVSSPIFDQQIFQQFFEKFYPTLWNAINDAAEPVRETAILLTTHSLKKLPNNNRYIDELIPILIYRLSGIEPVENSEELRLNLVDLLSTIVEIYQKDLEPYIKDIVLVLEKTLIDNYPKVRQSSGICCQKLSDINTQAVYENTYKLVKPILQSFNHNHSKTRVSAVEALSAVLANGNWKYLEAQLIFGRIGELVLDPVPIVRLAVAKLLGFWMTKARDRYSFFNRMIPLMLSLVIDEQPEVEELAKQVWARAGEQFVTENEQELKDRMDFLEKRPTHYPPKVTRPNFGCRVLVQRHTYHMTSAIIHELSSWKTNERMKAGDLLKMVTLHAEDEITQHLENLVVPLFTVCFRGSPTLVEAIEQATEYIGYFVPVSTWYQVVTPILFEEEITFGHLRILGALLRGSKSDELANVIEPLTKFLTENRICTNRSQLYQKEILRCCKALMLSTIVVNENSEKYLFVCLAHVKALAADEQISKTATECFEKLSAILDVTVDKLFEKHSVLLLDPMKKSTPAWNHVATEHALMLLILKQAGSVWFRYIQDIMDILKEALNPNCGDATSHSELFIKLLDIVNAKDIDQGNETYLAFTFKVIKDLICPHLVWQAGRTAESLRTIVCACLLSIIVNAPLNKMHKEDIDALLQVLLPLTINCVEDYAVKTRLYAVQSLIGIIELGAGKHLWTDQHVNLLFPVFLKRLDDASDEVRDYGVTALIKLYSNLPEEYTCEHYRPHFESAISSMLDHLDDPNPDFQNHLTECFQVLGRSCPEVIKEKLTARLHRFQSQDLCRKLLEQL